MAFTSDGNNPFLTENKPRTLILYILKTIQYIVFLTFYITSIDLVRSYLENYNNVISIVQKHNFSSYQLLAKSSTSDNGYCQKEVVLFVIEFNMPIETANYMQQKEKKWKLTRMNVNSKNLHKN